MKKKKRNVSPIEQKESHRVTSRSSRTRQDKRNDRLYNKTQLIKKIEEHVRYFCNQKCNVPKKTDLFTKIKFNNFNSKQKKSDNKIKRLRKEVKYLREELNYVKNELRCLEQENIDLNSQSLQEVAKDETMRKEIELKNKNIDELINQVTKLNLNKEKKINMIENLNA
ncbi:2591_t:CDS:2 [Racocetra persica]|uniref:2591_t:CDS:1 n=1 Tax=Racocetra persica TaxID=160502 RepID=A0ACA9KV42_9GLOM|nr:2591_t:CDS:2 [Racocetra persica]